MEDLTPQEKQRRIQEAPQREAKLRKQFNLYKKFKIHPVLFHNTYDITMFDIRGNTIFSANDNKTYKIGPPGREKNYKPPSGWIRYGLKVLGKYNDDKWLHPFKHPDNWYRAYHATSRNVGAIIFNDGFRISDGKNGTAAAYGPGTLHMS